METVLINNRSAIECFDRGFVDTVSSLPRVDRLRFIGGVHELDNYSVSMPPISKPCSILVAAQEERNHSRDWRCQTWSKPLPPGSVYPLQHGEACVSAPWFCFLQMASKLNLVDGIRLGMELCGSHSTLPFAPGFVPNFSLSDEERHNGFVTKPAIITANELRAQVASAFPVGTRSKVATAVRFVMDNSRSPGESRLYILLCLPLSYGGYGLPKPLLNFRIDLTDELKEIAGWDRYYVDMYYHRKRLAIEYDGGYHWMGEQRMDDNLRELILKKMNIEVIRIDKRQLQNRDAMDLQARELAKKLGVRVRASNQNAYAARTELRKQVLDWSSNPYRL